ncbi:MAG: CRISPR-associated endoribonuclease Cas6, partial [Chloroflexota bacterium]
MRAIVCLNPTASAGALLPIQYNAIVQGLIYSSWNERMARFVHERGFPVGARSFRLFVFSRLSGPYDRVGDCLHFRGPVTLQVASPIHALVEELASTWLRGGTVRLGEETLSVDSVDLRPTPAVEGAVVVRTLSPVTIYESLHAADGRTKTYYYAPTEREFG